MHAFLPFYADHITAGMVIVMESRQDFVIKNSVRINYRGPSGDVTIPEGVTEIGPWAVAGWPNPTIHAPAGSYVEEYAKKNKIKFETI